MHLSEVVVGRVRHPQFLLKSDFKLSCVHSVNKRHSKAEEVEKTAKRRRLMEKISELKRKNLTLVKNNIEVLRAINGGECSEIKCWLPLVAEFQKDLPNEAKKSFL